MQNNSLLLVMFAVLGLSFCVNAQNKNTKIKQQTVNKPFVCKSNEVVFPCPKDFSVLFEDETDGLLLLKSKSSKTIGMFIIASASPINESNVVESARKTLLLKLFPKQPQSYALKDIDALFFSSQPLSKYDVSFGTKKGFNEKQLIVTNFRRIRYNEKDIFVGYAYELATGKDAREGFNEEFVDSLSNTCIAQIELVYSITGEKRDKNSYPCSLMEDISLVK